MKYLEVQFEITPNNEAIVNILTSELGNIGFDSFVEDDNKILAYVQQKLFEETELKQLILEFPIDVSIAYTIKEMEDVNWNEEWEKNYFSPIVVNDRCVVKSSFHKDVPDYEYTIIINPKMAFGTGHHQTTVLMMQEILKKDFSGELVLDMGCGTAILAILASMRNASEVLAIDIDEWAYDNAIENLRLNNIENVEVQIGGAELLAGKRFDTIIANINRNILLQDMKSYAQSLNENGTLFMSGFYVEDIDILKKEAEKYGLSFIYHIERDNWAGVKFIKK